LRPSCQFPLFFLSPAIAGNLPNARELFAMRQIRHVDQSLGTSFFHPPLSAPPSAGADRPTIKQLLLSAEQPKSSAPDKVFKYLNYGRSLGKATSPKVGSIKNGH
jgi:hypothetical protein